MRTLDSMVESAIDSALADIISAAISFVLSNLVIILMVLAILLALLLLIVLIYRRKTTINLLEQINGEHQEMTSKLNMLIVSEAFKELESGLMQGKTKQTLEQLQKAMLASFQQAAQIQQSLNEQKVPFFSPFKPYLQVKDLEQEVDSFAHRVDRYSRDLAKIERLSSEANKQVQQLNDMAAKVSRLIDDLVEQTSYPLDELRFNHDQMQATLKQAEQSASFDPIQAHSDVIAAQKDIESVQRQTTDLQKDIDVFSKMKSRLSNHASQVEQSLELVQGSFQDQDPLDIIHQAELIVQQLESSLRAGKQVDLRSSAADIEQLLQDAHQLIEDRTNE